ncbi:MAG: hypothetical protein RBU37_13045 [Myxococcota bacterium]|jgi:hypothetical protein|nr:hypothetical protein [Myxococcota bacterium]
MVKLSQRYQRIIDTCEPFLVSYSENLSALDLAPFGFTIAPERIYSPTSLRSRDVIDGLHHLDSFSFGPQEMLMPRWVLFDCGEFPGIVFGFGCLSHTLSAEVRARYHVEERDDVFVPLSMWVAIRCAREQAWFGHNLSSANLVLGEASLPGLGTFTKTIGVKITQARHQYGATQWNSSSINVHLNIGEMELLSAYTPAHTHPETFTYLIEVDDERLLRSLSPDWQRPRRDVSLTFRSDEPDAIRQLHDDIEAGSKYFIASVQTGKPNTLNLWKAP